MQLGVDRKGGAVQERPRSCRRLGDAALVIHQHELRYTDATEVHSAVQDCAVIGAPDPEWGEIVTAVVQLRAGAAVSAHELLDLCRARLGSIKTPKRLEFVQELPRSPNGNVLKRELRDRYWSHLSRKI